MTLRSIGDVERTVVVVHSISFDVPDQLVPERYYGVKAAVDVAAQASA